MKHLVTSPKEIAKLQSLTNDAQSHREKKGCVTLYHRKKSGVLAGGNTPFNSGKLTPGLIRRAENFRLALSPLDNSNRARALRGLVDGCPDEWLFQPGASLVESVLDRAEQGVEETPEAASFEAMMGGLDSALCQGMGAAPDAFEWEYTGPPEDGDTPQELCFD